MNIEYLDKRHLKSLKRRRSKLNKKLKKLHNANANANAPLLENFEMEVEEETTFVPERPTRNLSSDEIQNLIPAFNPNSSLSLNSEEWIEEVENVSALCNWNDELTILYASLRLEDEAKIWFRENRCNWQQFKLRFVREFPISHHRSQFIGQLLKRRKEDAETFEDYANDVARISWNCNFNLPTTISYIISGLSDANMRNRLIAYNCKSIPEVLSRIQTINFNQEQEAKWNDSITQITNDLDNRNQSSQKDLRDNTTKRRPEEESFIEPPLKRSTTTAGTVATTSTSSFPPIDYDDWRDIVTTVKLANVFLSAFVDLATKFTTLQKSEFLKHPFKLHPCNIQLRGFGQGLSRVLGKICETVIAGQVEMLIEILIVEDAVQNYPIILGRNFLHNPNVSVIKNFESLEINFVESKTTPKKKKKRSRNRGGFFKQIQDEKKHDIGQVETFIKEEKTMFVEKEIILRVRQEKNKVTVSNNTGAVSIKTNQTHEEQILDILNAIERDFL